MYLLNFLERKQKAIFAFHRITDSNISQTAEFTASLFDMHNMDTTHLLGHIIFMSSRLIQMPRLWPFAFYGLF